MIYETKRNELDERRIANYVSYVYGVVMCKTPQFAVVDYIALRDNKPVALIEIKSRKQTIEQINSMGGYLISQNKLESMRYLSDLLRLPATLVVRFDKDIYHHSIEDHYSTRQFSRNDRPSEIEQAAIIPTDHFRIMR